MSKSICSLCGASFSASEGAPGRPRVKCYTCSPSQLAPKRKSECQQCGAVVWARGGRKYCSDACKYQARVARNPVKCSECGEPMPPSQHLRKDGTDTHGSCKKRIIRHGARGYDKGCRCQECRDGTARRMREYAAQYKAKHGTTPSKRWKRERRGVPVEDQVCVKCGEPLKTSYFHDDVEPMHRRCRGNVSVSDSVRRAIHERDHWACHLCGESTEPESGVYDDWYPTLDHVIPRSKGGDDSMENLKTCHRWCNLVRGVRPVEEMELRA